jgi:hypothetical protein
MHSGSAHKGRGQGKNPPSAQRQPQSCQCPSASAAKVCVEQLQQKNPKPISNRLFLSSSWGFLGEGRPKTPQKISKTNI